MSRAYVHAGLDPASARDLPLLTGWPRGVWPVRGPAMIPWLPGCLCLPDGGCGERVLGVNQDQEPSRRLLQQVMADVQELVARHGWETTPRRRMAFLLGEVVELADEVLQLPVDGPYDSALQQRIGREIYDVMWNACDLARLTGIDVMQAAADKRQMNAGRVWPGSA